MKHNRHVTLTALSHPILATSRVMDSVSFEFISDVQVDTDTDFAPLPLRSIASGG